ncbi:MAG TPA: hypothetical protein VK837_13085 [Longimicrobiales bacterium]|nr:hypothetical protein [Longimicrobiales bacterium]
MASGGRAGRTLAWIVVGVAAAAAAAAFLLHDQMARHRRDLFSPHPLRRLAALGYLGTMEPSVESVHLLRDFLAWEPRPLLRKRAALMLQRMEARLIRQRPDEAAG